MLSWLLLRGRCRTCAEPISGRYPIVEGLNAVLWLGLVWWAWGPDGIDPLLPWLLVLGSAGLALWFIDIDHHRLPDAIVLPLYPIGVAGLVLAGVVSARWPLAEVAIGVGAWLVVIGGIWLFTGGRAMGFGDVKLAPVLAATLAWVGVSSRARRPAGGVRAGRCGRAWSSCSPAAPDGAATWPSGPSCCSAPWSGCFWGEALGSAYLATLGL